MNLVLIASDLSSGSKLHQYFLLLKNYAICYIMPFHLQSLVEIVRWEQTLASVHILQHYL